MKKQLFIPDKPIFTPSSLSAFERCKRFYQIIYELRLDLQVRLEPKPTLGTFVHLLQAAYHTLDDPESALKREVKNIKTGPFYNSRMHPVLMQLAEEAVKIFAGGPYVDSAGKQQRAVGYPEWWSKLRLDGKPLEVMAVERRLYADMGSIIGAPRLDLVLESWAGEVWATEWKVTERDDAKWANRWRMDGQTTFQALALEAEYKRPVKGVLVMPILISRKRPKEGQDSILGRPLCRIERPEARWVVKNSPTLKQNYLKRLEYAASEYKRCLREKTWPTTGMDTRQCDDCRFAGICSGQDSWKRLQPLPGDDLAKLRKAQRLGATTVLVEQGGKP